MRVRPIVRYGSVIAAVALAVLLVANLALGDKRIDQKVEHEYPVASAQFARVVDVAFGPALTRGNRARALVNGDQIFPAMLEAIRGARRTITFEMYIYAEGAVGEAFTEAFAERARAGVKIHFLYDAVGSEKIDKGFESKLIHTVRGIGYVLEVA